MQLKIIRAFPPFMAIRVIWLLSLILLAEGVTMNMKLPAVYSTLIRRDLAKHWPRFHYPLMIGMAANEMNGHDIGEQFEQFKQFREDGSAPKRLWKRAPFSAARFDRLLLGALLWPNLQRRRTRGVQHQQQQQQYFAERPIRGTWRPAFHRTGGTILLGKRGGGEEEKRLFPLEMNREWPEEFSAEESSWQD